MNKNTQEICRLKSSKNGKRCEYKIKIKEEWSSVLGHAAQETGDVTKEGGDKQTQEDRTAPIRHRRVPPC